MIDGTVNGMDDTMTAFLQSLREREARGKERLAKVDAKRVYFAILGLRTDTAPVSLHPLARIVRVVDAPGEIELAAALSDFGQYGNLAKYARSVHLELEVDWREDDETALAVGQLTLIALRIRTLGEFLVPAAADHSWSNLCGLKKRECKVWIIEDFPTFRPLESPRSLTAEDAQWVFDHVSKIGALTAHDSFGLAVESLCFHQHLSNLRMMVAMLWSGIEGLFSLTSELRFRLASFIAALLEPHGERRRELYKEIKRLYDFRSKVVHGGVADNEAIVKHIIQVRAILSRLLCRIVEQGLWTDEMLEQVLFG